jgi:hypothetical protein
MSTLVEFQTASGPILIQTKADVSVSAVSSTADGLVAKADRQLRDSLAAVTALANEFAGTLKGIESCSAAELKFGLDVSGKGNVFVVETTAKAAFEITLTFDIAAERTPA